MTTQERWDVVLRVLNGPQASLGDQTFRGPVVRVGGNPGPGGMRLTGYRGLDQRQCVVTAYDGGTVSVAPVGANQVRLAPHPNVQWKDINPIRGPEYLSKGSAMHIGPVGRGATIEFVEARRLGVWNKGELRSAVSGHAEGAGAAGGLSAGAPPAAFDAHQVRNIEASNAPFWFLGCMVFMSGSVAISITLMGVMLYLNRTVVEIGPVEQGLETYKSVALDVETLDADLLEGLHRPFYDFVMAPNIQASGGTYPELDQTEKWDQNFLNYTTASVSQHARAWQFFARINSVRREYAQVVTQLRQAGLPEVFAAIPYQESRYRPGEVSVVCAKGYWQFMPEVALRVERKGGLNFKVRDCRFKGSGTKWNPVALTPPPNAMKNAEYMDEGVCQIDTCDVDDRTDLRKSTAAAIYTLKEAYDDPVLRNSGAVVQLAIASHNTGYDDSRFGRNKSTNVLPALKAYKRRNGDGMAPNFYGDSIRCRSHDDPGRCGSELMAQTQHYVYPIVAQHLLAVCYYAMNYGEDRAFSPWIHYTASDGYCRSFRIPTKDEVLRNKGGS